MIFIGYNERGFVTSIISAKTEESANAYLQGKGLLPHRTEKFDQKKERENEEMGFVTPLLLTEKKKIDLINSYELIVVLKNK